MSNAENLERIYECLRQDEEEIRCPAEKQLIELRKNNLIGFIETNLDILKNAESFSQIALYSSLLYSRLSFSKATKAKRSNDDTKQYLLIPLELANQFPPVVFELLTNQELRDFAAMLLGQISTYFLCFDPEHQILSLICQELPNKNVSIQCCTAIEYIFQEIEVSLQLQSIVLSTITPLLSDEDFPSEIKSKLITVISSMILSLPKFLPNDSERQEFAQSMLSLVSIQPLKKASYDFWESVTTYFPSLIEFIPDICEISFNDLKGILDEKEQNSDLLISILQLWTSIGDQKIKKEESLATLLTQAIPAFFPLFLTVCQNVPDPDSLDSSEDYEPHTEARESILSLTCAMPDQSIPILLEFAEQAMANLESNPSSVLKETILFSFSVVIDAYKGNENEENENEENDKQIESISTQCIQLISQCLSETGENSSIRVISQSLKLLLSIVESYPELYDYSEYIEFLMNCMQNANNNPFIEETKELLHEIVFLPNFKGNLPSIFESLLSFDNIPSLCLAKDILKKHVSVEFAQHYLPQIIALAEIYAKNECFDTPSDAEKTQEDVHASTYLLPLTIQMIVILIDKLKGEAIPFLHHLFEMMQFTYDTYKHPEALLAICSIASITNQNVLNAVNLVITELNNSILSEDATTEVELPSYEMRLAAISSITLYLSKCKSVKDNFHELMRILLRLLESQQENSNVKILDSGLKIEVIEALNSLHFNFPDLMKQFFDKLLPIYGIALENLPSVEIQNDDKDIAKVAVQMNYAILEGIKLLLMNDVGDSTPTVLQMAIAAIQSAIDSPNINPRCATELVDLLKVLMKISPGETKNFISTNEDLNLLFEEAKEQEGQEELVRSIESLMKMM